MGFIGKARGHVEEQKLSWDKIREIKSPIPIQIEWVIEEDGFSRPHFTLDGKTYGLVARSPRGG
jgi:hypothetical protein